MEIATVKCVRSVAGCIIEILSVYAKQAAGITSLVGFVIIRFVKADFSNLPLTLNKTFLLNVYNLLNYTPGVQTFTLCSDHR
jgi:hypothetical protein